MKSTAVIVATNAQTLAANDYVEFTSANNITGKNVVFNAGTSPINLKAPGLYLVLVNANLLGTAAGNVTLQLTDNGNAVTGANATVTTADGSNYAASFSSIIQVTPSGCCCNCINPNVNTSNLQLQVLTTGVTVQNAAITIVKIA